MGKVYPDLDSRLNGPLRHYEDLKVSDEWVKAAGFLYYINTIIPIDYHITNLKRFKAKIGTTKEKLDGEAERQAMAYCEKYEGVIMSSITRGVIGDIKEHGAQD